MKPIAPRLLVLLFCLIALITFQRSGLAQGTNKESTIVFEAQGLPVSTRTHSSDEYGMKIESIRWRDFVSNYENAMVESWQAPEGFISSIGNVKKLPFFYRLDKDPDEPTFYRSKGIRIEFMGDIEKVNTVYGKIDYIRARVPSNKICFFFQRKHKVQKWKGPKKVIQGWYCSADGQPLSDDTIHSAITSIRVKGWKLSQ